MLLYLDGHFCSIMEFRSGAAVRVWIRRAHFTLEVLLQIPNMQTEIKEKVIVSLEVVTRRQAAAAAAAAAILPPTPLLVPLTQMAKLEGE